MLIQKTNHYVQILKDLTEYYLWRLRMHEKHSQ